MPLPSLGYHTPVRICNDCYRALSSTQHIREYSEDDFQVLEQTNTLTRSEQQR
jgi:hypothetical protein